MIAELDAIKAAVTDAGLRVYFADAGLSPAYPYVLLWTGSGRPADEVSVARSGDFVDDLGVTCVAGTPEGVLTVQAAVRDALAPFAAGVATSGRLVWLSLYDSRAVQVDRDVTITSSGKHPAYGVDMYRLTSVPA